MNGRFWHRADAAGFLVTFIGFDHVMTVTKGDYDHHAAEIELFFTFCTPNVMAMSVAVFLLAKKVTRVTGTPLQFIK